MNKRVTVLICNDMREADDPIVVSVSGASPIDIILQAKIAHAENEMSDFDGDPLTAADLWEVSRAWIMAMIPGEVIMYYAGSDPAGLHCALLDVITAAPVCAMGADHETA